MAKILKPTIDIKTGITEINKVRSDLHNEESHILRALLKKELLKLLAEIEKDPSYNEASRAKFNETVKQLLELLEEEAEHKDPQKKYHIPSKEVHYNRNQNMPIERLPQSPKQAVEWGWNDKVASDCHQFSSPDKSNVKYVSPDGKDEVIFDFDGVIVTAPEDCGTYNFADPETDPIGHFYEDVLPWLMWGNSVDDTTNTQQRLRAFVVLGGANALINKVNSLKKAPAPAGSEA